MPRTWDGSAWVDDPPPPPPTVEWGDITGTVADQTDLGDAATRDVGTTAGTVTAGDDARLSDARTPTAHAASHADGGADEIAVHASQVTDGQFAAGRVASGPLTDGHVPTISSGALVLAAPSGGGGVGERVWIPIPSPWSAQSGSVSVVASSSQMYAVVAFGSGVGHYYQWSTRLTGGTWAMHLLFGRTTTGGIITPSVAGVDLATIDTYNSSTTPNIPATYSGLVVASSAVVPIRFRVDAKNPSSSAYESRINGLWLERTA